MPPPTIEAIDVLRQALQDRAAWSRPCEPATIATSGRFGSRERLGDRVDLGGEQRPGAGDRRELGDAVGRRLGAMRGAERVVDEDVAERRHLPRQRRVVLLLALVEAAVLEHDDLARRDGDAVDPVRSQRHGAAEQLAEARRDRRERVLGLRLALGRPAEVRGDHHRRAGGERHLDARQRGADPRVLGDAGPAIVLRHVEVGADEDAALRRLAGGDEVCEAKDVHSGAIGVAHFTFAPVRAAHFTPNRSARTFHRCPAARSCAAALGDRAMPVLASLPRRSPASPAPSSAPPA